MWNTERAVVPFESAHGPDSDCSATYSATDAKKLKRAGASPHELILHESISHLITEMAELRARCEDVETTNEQLMKRVTGLERAYCDDLARAPLTKAKLTGYAASESSSYDDTKSAQDAENVKRFEAVGLLLEDYNSRLQAQADRQARLEARVHELNSYKRSSESLFKALRAELEDVHVDTTNNATDDRFFGEQRALGDVATTFIDRKERLEGRFNTFELELKEQLEDFDGRMTAATAVLQAGDGVLNGHLTISGPAQNDKQRLTKLENNVAKLIELHKKAKEEARQKQHIDDASTKDALYSMFADIDSIMGCMDDQRRRCGEFEGTPDELWPLKDRVTRRIASFDACGKAFQEARQAVKDLA